MPAAYPFQQLRALHGRDQEAVSERVNSDGSITKNLRWQGCCVQLVLQHDAAELAVQMHASRPLPSTDEAALKALCIHLAGLQQHTQQFAEQHGQHPQFAPVLQQQPHLFVPQVMPFEALCWAIIGQLISVPAAITIRRRFILAGGQPFNGLHSFPCHQLPLQLGVEGLRGLGLPQRKAQALHQVALTIEQQADFLPPPHSNLPAEAIGQRLQRIKGIGPWTAQYTLLRGYNHLGADLSGDVAVRRALGQLLGSERPSAAATHAWLQQFAPYQALAAAHLWQWEQKPSL